MNERRRSSAWVAYAAALWAFIFGVFHVIWACGWYVGLDQEQSRIAFRKPLFFAYDLVVAGVCFLAVPVALALVQPWGRRLPRSLLGSCAWLGTGLLVLRSGASLIQMIYHMATGRFSVAAVGIWEPWFLLGAVLFSASTWRFMVSKKGEHRESTPVDR
jgi:magnesium-transporting ATPase (P-type)